MDQSSSKWRKQQTIIYTPRDIRFLLALWGNKYMSTTQICALFWGEASRNRLFALKSCQRRLRQLEQYGLIRRIPQAVKRGEGSKPDIFKLAAKSIPLLAYECGVDPKAVDITIWADEEVNPQLKHILATTDVRIAFLKACQTGGYTIDEWIDESALRSASTQDTVTVTDDQGNQRQVALIPDAFFILSREGKRGMYRLEVDRATIDLVPSNEQKRSISQKIGRYLLLEQSAWYQEQYGTRPLQVLWVVTGKQRMRNMMHVTNRVIQQRVEWLGNVPAAGVQSQDDAQKRAEFTRLSRRFLFTTLEQIKSQNVVADPIWQVVGSETLRTLIE